MTTFDPVGADNGRVPVPAGAVNCPNMSTFLSELDKVMPGGSNAGGSVDLHLSGTSYGEIGTYGYECTDGGTGLGLYGNQDGSTVIGYIGTGNTTDRMLEAHGAVIRLGSASGQFDDTVRVGIYNFEVDGNSTGDNVGAFWGVIIGGANETDQYRSNCFEVVVRGLTIHHTQNSGIKVDGNGGTDGVELAYLTTLDIGQQYEGGYSGVQGIGEMYYVGDGNTGRAYNDVWIHHCYGDGGGINFGEGINTKRNGTNVRIEDCLIENVLIDNGGGIACEEYVEIRRCRVHDITRSSYSDTSYPSCYAFENGGLIENSMGWTNVSNGLCLKLDHSGVGTVTSRHNTFNASGSARGCYSINEFGNATQVLVAENDAYSGVLSRGSNAPGGSISADEAVFVGPSTGSANAGSGVGSGLEIASGAARNSVSTLTLTEDIQGLARVSPTDAGAIDADAATGTAPTITFVSSAFTAETAGGLQTEGSRMAFLFNASDDGSLNATSLEMRITGPGGFDTGVLDFASQSSTTHELSLSGGQVEAALHSYGGLVNGTYSCQVWISDNDSNQSNDSGDFALVNAAPIVAIDPSYATIHWTSPNLALNATATDDQGWSALGDAEIRVDGGVWVTVPKPTQVPNFTGSVGYSYVDNFTPGTHIFEYRVTDSLGEQHTASSNFTINSAPEITISSPAEGSSLPKGTTSVTVSGAATDDVTVDLVEVSVDGGAYQNASGTGSFTANVTGLGEGAHTINVRATDDNGFVTVESVSFTILENTAPSASISSPLNGNSFPSSTTSVNLAGTASDPDGTVSQVQRRVNGGAWAPVTGTTSWSGTLTGLTGGNTYIVEVRAVDNDGAFTDPGDYESVTFTVGSNTAPTIVISSPADGFTAAAGATSITMSGSAADDVAVDLVQVRSDGGAWITATGNESWSHTFTGLSVGSHLLEARAQDADGSTSPVAAITVTIAAAANPPTLAIASPSPNDVFSWGSTSVIVSGTASDDVGLASILYRINGGAYQNATGLTSWAASIPVSAGNAYFVEVLATDTQGATASDSITFTTETIPSAGPTLTLTSHSSGGAIDSENLVPISGSSSGLSSVQYRLGRRADSGSAMQFGEALDLRRTGNLIRSSTLAPGFLPQGGSNAVWQFTFRAALHSLAAGRERNLAGLWGNDSLWRIYLNAAGNIFVETMATTGVNTFDLGPVSAAFDFDDMVWFRIQVDTAGNSADLQISTDSATWNNVSSVSGDTIGNAVPRTLAVGDDATLELASAGGEDALTGNMSLAYFSWNEGGVNLFSLDALSNATALGALTLSGWEWSRLSGPRVPYSQTPRTDFDWWDGAAWNATSAANAATGTGSWSATLPDEIDAGIYYAIQVRGVEPDGTVTPW